MIVLDTDHLSILLDPRSPLQSHVLGRLEAVDDVLAIPVVSVEEQLRAWLAQVHRVREVHQQIVPYGRLVKIIRFLADWHIAEWNAPAADAFERLRTARIRVGTQDLKIAAITLANDALLLSANLRDFQQVPDLKVEDWIHA
jgi:tRNA(fMet)-specific endonuclease VapC